MVCPNINNKKLILFCFFKILSARFCRIEAAPLNGVLDPYTSSGHLKARTSQIYIPLTTSNILHFYHLSRLSSQLFITSSFFLRNLPLKPKTKVFFDFQKWSRAFISKEGEEPSVLKIRQQETKMSQLCEEFIQASKINQRLRKKVFDVIRSVLENFEAAGMYISESLERDTDFQLMERGLEKFSSDRDSKNFLSSELISCFQATFNTFKGWVADLPFDTQLTVKNKISKIQKILDLEKLDLRTSYPVMEEGEETIRMFSESYARPQKEFIQYMESIEACVIKLTRTFNVKFNELQDQLSKSQKNFNKSLQINKDLERKNEMLEKQADASCSLIGLLLSRTDQNSDKQEILNDLEKGLQCLEEQIGVLNEQLQDTATKRVVQIFISRLLTDPDMKRKEEIDLLDTPLQDSIAENEAYENRLKQELQRKLNLKKAYEEQIFKLKHPGQRAGEQGDEIEMKTPSLPAANTPVKEPCGLGVCTANLSTTGASPFLDERPKNNSIVKQQPLKKKKRLRIFFKSLWVPRPTPLSSPQKMGERPETASDIF